MCSLYIGTNCLSAEETTQLQRKATWEKGPSTEPQTRDLRSVVKFQPSELRNLPCSFVPWVNVGWRSVADPLQVMGSGLGWWPFFPCCLSPELCSSAFKQIHGMYISMCQVLLMKHFIHYFLPGFTSCTWVSAIQPELPSVFLACTTLFCPDILSWVINSSFWHTGRAASFWPTPLTKGLPFFCIR